MKAENPASHKYVVGNGSKVLTASNTRALNFVSLTVFNQKSKYFEGSNTGLRVKSFFKSMKSSCKKSGTDLIVAVNGDTIHLYLLSSVSSKYLERLHFSKENT